MMNELGETSNIKETKNSKQPMNTIIIQNARSNKISFKLNKPGSYSFNIISLNGSRLRTFDYKNYKRGLNHINTNNNPLSSGTYLLETIGEKQKIINRIIIN